MEHTLRDVEVQIANLDLAPNLDADLDGRIQALPQELQDKIHEHLIVLRLQYLPEVIRFRQSCSHCRRPIEYYEPPLELSLNPETRKVAARVYYGSRIFHIGVGALTLPKFIDSLTEEHRALITSIHMQSLFPPPLIDVECSDDLDPLTNLPRSLPAPSELRREGRRDLQMWSSGLSTGLKSVLKMESFATEEENDLHGPFSPTENSVWGKRTGVFLSEEDFIRLDGPLQTPAEALNSPSLQSEAQTTQPQMLSQQHQDDSDDDSEFSVHEDTYPASARRRANGILAHCTYCDGDICKMCWYSDRRWSYYQHCQYCSCQLFYRHRTGGDDDHPGANMYYDYDEKIYKYEARAFQESDEVV